MKSKYSKKTKEEAKLLYEQGVPEPQIAKMLGIKRPQTINDWRAKFGWQRWDPKVDIKILRSKPEMIAFWESLGLKAINALRSTKIKSSTEALRILKEASQFLTSIDKMFKEPDSGEKNEDNSTNEKETKIPDHDVLNVLDNISEMTDEKDDNGSDGEFDNI